MNDHQLEQRTTDELQPPARSAQLRIAPAKHATQPRSLRRLGILALLPIALLAACVAPPAPPEADDPSVNPGVDSTLEAVASDHVRPYVERGQSIAERTGTPAQVNVPVSGAEPVALEVSDTTIEIDLPTPTGSQSRRTGNDVIHTAESSDYSLMVESLDSGVQVLIVMDSEDAPTEYPFPVSTNGGHAVEILEDGSAVIFEKEFDTRLPDTCREEPARQGALCDPLADADHDPIIGTIQAPWAVDASGAEIPTWFTVDGDTLVQHVDHVGAAYPVVADPIVFGVLLKTAGQVVWAMVKVYGPHLGKYLACRRYNICW